MKSRKSSKISSALLGVTARNAASSLRIPSSAASCACRTAQIRSRGRLRLRPCETGDDLPGLARDRERIERRAFEQAARSARSDRAGRECPRLKPFAKDLRFDASASSSRVAADPQAAARQIALNVRQPRRRPAPTTKRISCVDRLHLARDDAKPLACPAFCGPLSSSAIVERARACVHLTLARFRGFFAGFFGGGLRRQIGFGDPAGLQARLHDDRFGFLARHFEAVEKAGLALGLAVLAFGPADEIVGGAAGQILDGLDARSRRTRPASAW